MHKRISTSIKKSQAEPGECWPAEPSQSLLPRRDKRAGAEDTRKRKRCEEGGKKTTDRKAALQLKYKTIHPSAKGKRNHPNRQEKNTQNQSNHQQMCPHSCFMTLQLLLILVQLRNTLEGYEPDGAGVKHSQNYCCDEGGAIVSTLDFCFPSEKKKNCDVKITSQKKIQHDNCRGLTLQIIVFFL